MRLTSCIGKEVDIYPDPSLPASLNPTHSTYLTFLHILHIQKKNPCERSLSLDTFEKKTYIITYEI